jgi:hypothetical protein
MACTINGNGADHTVDATLPYSLSNLRVEFVATQPPGVQTAFWHDVGQAYA